MGVKYIIPLELFAENAEVAKWCQESPKETPTEFERTNSRPDVGIEVFDVRPQRSEVGEIASSSLIPPTGELPSN
ncbi:hypothetical protein CEXT_539331 [Caerostris extrusa]|uniref:Uncharacterized protein n=1 Tax=Caerostris extrusa TaxID=172846 RepID=A0AAV4MDA4_CAEEX|nr:hypothetical protein CEXT_539331 [Caerostris extrusa]